MKTQVALITSVLLNTAFLNPSQASELDKLSWLAGTWKSIEVSAPMDAQFSTPDGGVILSAFRVVNQGRLEFYEFEKIEEKDGALVLYPYPFGNAGVSFALKELTPTRVAFENPQHDFPRLIVYELNPDSGRLVVRVKGKMQGQAVAETWELERK